MESAAGGWGLKGKLWGVTGGALGIGVAVVEEFLSLGAAVLVVARDAARLEEKLARWRETGARAYGLAADVSESVGRERVLARVGEFGAGLDILVNNVGTNIRKSAVEYT